MTTAQLIPLMVPAAIFISAAFALVLLGLLQYRLASRVAPHIRVAVAILIIGFGSLLSVLLTTRSLNESSLNASGVVLYEDYADGFSASRWLSLFLLGAAVIEIVRGCLRARAASRLDPAWPLLASMLLFYIGTLAIQALFSEHAGFSYKESYLPVILLAAYFQPLRDLRFVLAAAKLVILAVTLGSLLGIAVRPDFVLHRPDPGVIPGIDWRLFGLTPHANTLGPVALLGLLLELYSPSRTWWLRSLNLGAAVAVVVLAQSRTAWVAAALIAAVVFVPLSMAPARGAAPGLKTFDRAAWTVVACIVVVVVLAGGLVALGGTEYLQRKTDLGTLNGRFQIWDITLQAWRENVLFGYGPEVWGAERRQRFNMFHVGQAHDQFVQTLGEAGLAGLLLLIVYLLALLRAAWSRFAVSRGLGVALVLLLLARCVTESPMRSEGLLSWATFLHVLLLVVVCQQLRQRWPPPLLKRAPAGMRPLRGLGDRYRSSGFSTGFGRSAT